MRQLISLFKSLYSRPMLEIKFFSKQNSFFYAFEQLILSKRNSFFSDINNGYIFRRNNFIILFSLSYICNIEVKTCTLKNHKSKEQD